MNSHRSALLQRALATAGAVTMAATTVFVGAASADHPARMDEACRHWAPHPHPFIKVVAENNRFDAQCLEAPANRRFRIYLENHDRDEHNISIYTADPDEDKKAEQVFEGKAVSGRGNRSGWPPREDYAIDALPPGEYFFRDDKVKGMNGEIRVPKEEKD